MRRSFVLIVRDPVFVSYDRVADCISEVAKSGFFEIQMQSSNMTNSRNGERVRKRERVSAHCYARRSNTKDRTNDKNSARGNQRMTAQKIIKKSRIAKILTMSHFMSELVRRFVSSSSCPLVMLSSAVSMFWSILHDVVANEKRGRNKESESSTRSKERSIAKLLKRESISKPDGQVFVLVHNLNQSLVHLAKFHNRLLDFSKRICPAKSQGHSSNTQTRIAAASEAA